MHRVLIVGAGATGSAAAFRLRQLGVEAKLEVWEKARGPGGRMSTNRQEVEGSTVRADMGAQYISMDPTDTASSQVSELLLSKGVCTKVSAADLSGTPERPRDWHHLAGAAGGVNDALKTLIEEAGATPHYEKRVAALDLQNGVWRARPFDGALGFFDAVLLAVPGCGVGGDNLNKIHGSWEGMLKPEQNKQLTAVQHRWSFAFFLPGDCAAACESFFGPTSLEKLVDDEVVHLLCYQSRKVAVASGTKPGAVTVVAHTSLEWAKRHARDSGRDDRLLKEVAAHVRQLLQIDGPLTKLTATSKVITWKQCQVTKAVPTLPDGPCMVVSASPPLLLAGDYFTTSSFTGCIQSGFAAAEAVCKLLKDAEPKAASLKVEGGGKGSKGQGKKGNKGKGSWNDWQQADDWFDKGYKGKGKGKRKGGGGYWEPYR